MARWLNLESPTPAVMEQAAALGEVQAAADALHTVTASAASVAADRQLVDLDLSKRVLVVYIQRISNYVVPGGSMVLRAGDKLHLLADAAPMAGVWRLLAEGSSKLRSSV